MNNIKLKNVIHHSNFLILIILTLSVFTYLWNPLGFIPLKYDEGTYIGRAMHVLVSQTPQEGTFYDHPYFGQLFMGSIFWITGYPNLFHPTVDGDVVSTIKMLWLVPRLLIGIIGVIDTYLVYKIAGLRYNRNVALIATILFAILPITFIRSIFLESLQLPFLLSSILFAMYVEKNNSGENNKNKNISLVLLSGIFLGLAIFTKIPSFTMIPLVGYLVFTSYSKGIKVKALWFVPVILIPLFWPSYAFISDEFREWQDGIFWQTHRQLEDMNFIEITKQNTLLNAIVTNFLNMPILIGLGLAGLFYASIKKDVFLLLWSIPFLVFLNFIGLVRDFHLILLLPALSISAANFIMGLSNRLKREKIRKILPIFIISAIVVVGLASIMIPLTINNNNDTFAGIAFVTRYLQDNKNDNITVIADHIYSWIPKYVFHLGSEYLIPELDTDESPQNEKVLMVLDGPFRIILSSNDPGGKHLSDIYNQHSKNGTSTVETGQNRIVLPQPWASVVTSRHEIDLIDNAHLWQSAHEVSVLQNDRNLDILIKTNKTDKREHHAFLQTPLRNLTDTPFLLVLEYATKSPDWNTKFFIEIRDSDDQNKRYFRHELRNTAENLTNKIFIVPEDLSGRSVELRLGVATSYPGEYLLNVKRVTIL